MAYRNRFFEAPRWGKSVDERAEDRRRLAAGKRAEGAQECLADIAVDGDCDGD